jgi:glycosyltransferase involved in cell wall biosynthesis
VNVFAEGGDWVFEDLKRHFALAGGGGVEVLTSSEPLAGADVWVSISPSQAVTSPDLTRTVVCVHDLYEHGGIYEPQGDRSAVRRAGALVLAHPLQRRILTEAGISLEGVPVHEGPLGALSIFTVRAEETTRFSAGWVGRHDAHGRKRCDWFVEAMTSLDPARRRPRAVLIGRGLGGHAERLRAAGVDCLHQPRESHPIAEYPRLYRQMDCLVITSSTEAGPLPLFEALATGLPVISTPVGWAPHFAARHPRYVRLAESPAEIAEHLRRLEGERAQLFEEREEIAALVGDYRLEHWLRAVLRLAASLHAGRKLREGAPSGSPIDAA